MDAHQIPDIKVGASHSAFFMTYPGLQAGGRAHPIALGFSPSLLYKNSPPPVNKILRMKVNAKRSTFYTSCTIKNENSPAKMPGRFMNP